jgi:formate-dependent nitrite reductase membrane component NrfD
VSLYTWTKSIASGAYLVATLLALVGLVGWDSNLVRWVAPMIGLAFLAATGAVLIADLEHPKRFHYIFLRPQWRSWLVKGAFIILAYGVVLVTHLAATVTNSEGLMRALTVLGLPAALMTAVYTAFLFAQSKARDMWQSPLLPPHIAVQAILAGGAALAVVDAFGAASAPDALGWVVGGAALTHLLMVWGEVALPHGTAHAHLATWEMVRGRYSTVFWVGVALTGLAVAAPWLGVSGAVAALVGLLAHEHAYVQSAQSVPLA